MHIDPSAIARAWSPLLDGVPSRAALLAELAPRYAEPHRHYHGIDHIEALARLFVDVAAGPGWRAPVEVQLAILFHDAIYEPGRPDNEARSAELAIEHLADTQIDHARIAMMIRATKTHDQLGDPSDHDLAHFIDADMAIIGTPADIYDRYAEAVRLEFAAIPTKAYQRGRAAFLSHQQARPTLFHTPYFRARYEAQARANLERELATLGRLHSGA